MTTSRKRPAGGAVLLFVLVTLYPIFLRGGPILLPDKLLQALIAETSGEIALNNERMLGPFERNRPEREYTGRYWETEFMLEKLREYGFSEVQVEKYPSENPQWDAVRGRLTVTSPFLEKIADHDEVAAVLAGNSASSDVSTEMVYVPNGSRAESYRDRDVKGKVVLSEGSIRSLYAAAVIRNGAAGVVTYSTRYPDLYPNLIGWSSLPRDKESARGFGFMIRHPKGRDLARRLSEGEKIQVHAEVETRIYPGKLEVVTALIPGTDADARELVMIAHLFEGVSKQGGNDNYSGSVCILETGRTLLELIRRGVMPRLRRTIRFLWVPEISGTRAWIRRHPEEARNMLAGINMDMVGENLFLTRSIFNISRTAHSVPSFFNDVVQEFAELTVRLNNDAFGDSYGRLNLGIVSPNGSRTPFLLHVLGYDTGSDHQILSNGVVRVPTVYFECWPDDFYHTSQDTPDKTDSTQLKRVAFIAAASLITAGRAGPDQMAALTALVSGKGRIRIADAWARTILRVSAAEGRDMPAEYKRAAVMMRGAYRHERDNLNTLRALADGSSRALGGIRVAVNNLEREESASLASLESSCRFRCQALGIPVPALSLTPEEERLDRLVPERKARDMLARMDTRLRPGLPRDHPVFRVRHAAAELANFIDGRRSVLDIARAVMAECEGPDPKAVGEYFEALEKKGLIFLKRR